MIANTCLQYPLCVKWKTELPFEDTPRVSPSFSVKGSERFLTWSYSLTSSDYKLYISELKSETSYKPIAVTTFIMDPHIPILIDHATVRDLETNIWTKNKTVLLHELHGFADIGIFNIICLFHSTETHFEKSHVSTQTLSFGLQSLSSDFSTILRGETYPDVELECDDHSYRAHMSVLAARSEVFSGMFHDDMVDRECVSYDIEDVEPEVLELLLQYIYSGETTDLSENTARRLFQAADKYAVHGLRGACSDWMVENQTPENCLDLLVLANKHSDAPLMESVIHFAAKSLRLLRRESWLAFREKYPALAMKVYDKHYAVEISDQP